jgi:hypothetical protein
MLQEDKAEEQSAEAEFETKLFFYRPDLYETKFKEDEHVNEEGIHEPRTEEEFKAMLEAWNQEGLDLG